MSIRYLNDKLIQKMTTKAPSHLFKKVKKSYKAVFQSE